MTKIERQILSILKDDARVTPAQIAVMLGISEEETKATIIALEEEKIIVKYAAVVNSNDDESFCEALIEVKATPQKNRGFDSIAEEIMKFPEVKSVYLMSGGFDLTVYLYGRTIREVGLFISEKLSVMDGVLATGTHFILKKYKVDGVDIVGLKEEKREMNF